MSVWSDFLSVFKRSPEAFEAPELPAAAEPVAVTRFGRVDKVMGEVGSDEQRMLAAIQSGDDAGRAIYADWLEDQGRLPEAEYVRAELAVKEAGAVADAEARKKALIEAVGRFDFAGRRVATEFKAWLSRPTIEACVRFELQCPQQWSALAITADPRVRGCDVCRKTVRFCATVAEARDQAAMGQCVAVELSRPRAAGDLTPVRVMMAGRVSPRHG